MLNNQSMSDVEISCEGSDKKFLAHKWILAISSAKFQAMFHGEEPETNRVVCLPDTDEQSLKEFLRFIYTDECNLTAANAESVLRLAKRYVVPSLAEECFKYFERNLDSDAFSGISQSTLEQLLKRDSLNIKEVHLFKVVLKWSEAECSRKGIEANAQNKRAAIGNAIHHILFASMTHKEFAQNVSRSGILTKEELVLFYDTSGGVYRTSDVWNMSRKRVRLELLPVCRFGRYDYVYPATRDNEVSTTTHALGVSFTKPVKFHGVRLLGGTGQEKKIAFEFATQKVEGTFVCNAEGRERCGFDVMLDVPVNVAADHVVPMIATITGVPSPRVASQGKKTVKKNGITITFHEQGDVGSCHTRVEHGEFDEIFISKN